MGNSDSKDSKAKKEKVKGPAPTFGRNPNLNPADFIINGKKNEIIVKSLGSINGQQFIIEECIDCDIFILDHIASLTVDLCTNCRIFTGPVESSLFTSSGYSITDNFRAAGLNIWNNSWYDVFDFNVDSERGNYSLMQPTDLMDTKPHVSLSENVVAALVEHGIHYSTAASLDSFIPRTVGPRSPLLDAAGGDSCRPSSPRQLGLGLVCLYTPATATAPPPTNVTAASERSLSPAAESQLMTILNKWLSAVLTVSDDSLPSPLRPSRWLLRTTTRDLTREQLLALSAAYTSLSAAARYAGSTGGPAPLHTVIFAEVLGPAEDSNVLSEYLTELTVSKHAIFFTDPNLVAEKVRLVFEDWKVVM